MSLVCQTATCISRVTSHHCEQLYNNDVDIHILSAAGKHFCVNYTVSEKKESPYSEA